MVDHGWRARVGAYTCTAATATPADASANIPAMSSFAFTSAPAAADS
jgi:hypothetical protein